MAAAEQLSAAWLQLFSHSSLDPSPFTEKEGLVTTVCAWVDSIVNLLVKPFVFYQLNFCTMVTHVVD